MMANEGVLRAFIGATFTCTYKDFKVHQLDSFQATSDRTKFLLESPPVGGVMRR